MPPSSSRRPGAQLGNTNALKNGFYTRRFKKRDVTGIEEIGNASLAEEIAIIRILARRLVESSDPSADLYEIAGVLRAICLASATITRIIRAQSFLANDPSGFYADIDQAIRQVRIEMGIDPPPTPTDSLSSNQSASESQLDCSTSSQP